MKLTYDSLFEDNDLSKREVLNLAVLFSAILFFYCLLSKYVFHEEKRLAWAISLLNSALLSLCGVFYAVIKGPSFVSSIGNTKSELHNVNNFCIIVCTWFAIACAVDILFGLMCYRKHLGLITAYFHHFLFIWMMVFSCTGNGLFVTSRPFASSFVLATIEEIPTFLLALGSAFKSLRTDLGFGISFFILRIVFHVILLADSIYSRCDTPILCIYFLTLSMHLNWFYGWITKYASFKSKPRQKKME